MQFKKTKIVCTIGPSSSDEEILERLAVSGMNMARLNFSHGTFQERIPQINLIRKISRELKKPIAIMADLQGPKMRLGEIEGQRIITKREVIKLSVEPQEGVIPMQFDLSPFIKVGQSIFLNDGLIALKVLKVKGKLIEARALNNGVISSHKGVNVPDTYIRGAAFTSKDRADAEFALKRKVDYLALSFVQSAQDILAAQELIKKHNPSTKIVVKIEKKEAIKNLASIIEASDAVMVARGDLAIEVPAPHVPIIQQRIIEIARQFHRPVIIATQMLESMTSNPRPTRAETSDVANAVLDQVDAVMLSAETASGKYPVEAASIMDEIIHFVEDNPDYKRFIKINWESVSKEELSQSAVTSSAASLSFRIRAKAIVVATTTGSSARILSSFRPEAQIIAVTHDEQTSNQLSLVWGVRTLVVKPSKNFNVFLEDVLSSMRKNSFAKKGDKVIVVTGSSIGTAGGTDTIKVATI